jgi:hypothetical protein
MAAAVATLSEFAIPSIGTASKKLVAGKLGVAQL